MKISMKNPIFQRILRKYFPFFLMVLFVRGGILSPQKAFCEDEERKQNDSLAQILRQNHPLETLQKDIDHGSLPAISYYLSAFEMDLPILPNNCLAKAYADKGLNILQHQGGLIDPSLTREGFKDWAVSLAGILYFEAYFMHNHLCGAVPDLAKEREFLKIGCHLKKDYLKDVDRVEPICLDLEYLTPNYYFTIMLYQE